VPSVLRVPEVILILIPGCRHSWQNDLAAARFASMLNGAFKLELEKLLDTSQLPELGPGPRPGIKSEAELIKGLDKIFSGSDARSEQRELVTALVLLWHDHLDAAHELAQEIPNQTGSFIHGIMHRREPDFGNAAYWFRRVGKHPAFEKIATGVQNTLEEKGDAMLTKRLIPTGEWDPFAFISTCQEASRNSNRGEKELLCELQAIESRALLAWIWENQ